MKPDFNRSIQIDIPIILAGAFAFYTTYTPLPEFSTEAVPSPKPTQTRTYYFDVIPRLTLHGEPLPLNAVSIISCISKFMGQHHDEWDKHLSGMGQRGYNMVHFTPLMHRGESNSPYSLYDQLEFDKTAFPNGEKDVVSMTQKMEDEYGLLGLIDVVFNHTANNSKWLEAHPEAGYNIETAPHLESALDLDSAMLEFGNNLEKEGLPSILNSRDDLDRVMDKAKSKVINEIRLWEYYVLDVERDTKACVQSWREMNEMMRSKDSISSSLEGVGSWSPKRKADWIISNALVGDDRLGERFRRKVQAEIGAAYLKAQVGPFSKSADEHAASDAIRAIINDVNVHFYQEYDAELAVILEQLSNRIEYMRLADHGPKMGKIGPSSPLIETYFTRLPLNETTKSHNPKALALVNNGWIWAADAMKDNAGPSSRAYLRREVIVWSDCVKLRYGSGPQDNPYLWDRMAKYTRLMAKYFAAFRIDNCHSTPIHVAEYMLDQGRQIRPNLAVFAELFSGSEATDFVFVKRLGISSLIREAMQAWTTAEVSRLVHMHCGIPIGSFSLDEVSNADKTEGTQPNGTVPQTQEVVQRIRQSDVHALFFDCTHDNEPPAQKRDARDTLPNAALVAMCACATGSVFGYDEIYPNLIELVHETRSYTSVSSEKSVEIKAGEGGIGGIKRLLNQIHSLMGKDGYDETYLDHKDQYITLHRVHPTSRKGYFLIAHTAFPGYGNGNGGFAPVRLPGTRARTIGAWRLEVDQSQEAKEAAQNDKVLRGLPSRTLDVRGLSCENTGDDTTIIVPDVFPPGSIALFETWVPTAEHSEGLDKYVTTGARQAFKDLKLRDLNFVLYRCDPEERDTSDGEDGCYTIPGYGPLVYAGLQGWWSVLQIIIRNNDLGHPLCQHLREGQWALDFSVDRLERLSKIKDYDRLKAPAKWLRERFDAIRKVPSFLLPRYFARTIQTAYNAAVDRAIEQMSDNIQHGPTFLKSLALVSVQMSGYMKSTSLYPMHNVPSLAAGHPHFSHDWARCWGRDVFISLRGLLLGTGRFANAREHILAFASVMKHGMIPNLLGSGKITRFNSRDSIWFFLQNIQDYTKMAPNGMDILKDEIKRRFLPYDDTWFPWDDQRAYSMTSSIEDVIQESLQRHANGMSFREANAGPGIDSQMKDQGFQIDIHVNWDNGIIFGGNQYNCGTWMDKMGESEKAGNKGVPGTPRDGAAVEITGMLYSTLVWLQSLHEHGQFKHDGVDTSNGHFTWKAWAQKIKDNFERCYYVPIDPSEDHAYDVNPKIINRRGIYKDLYKSGKEYEDYELRPNFPVAMTVAPQLFTPEKALHALGIADHALRGPQGMATLDPLDLNYHPYYINSDDSENFATAKGRNYHQGPEWLWPTGFFLRALLKFDLMRRKTAEEKVETYQQITRRLAGCMQMIKDSPWAGLQELTNYNGAYCSDSVSRGLVHQLLLTFSVLRKHGPLGA